MPQPPTQSASYPLYSTILRHRSSAAHKSSSSPPSSSAIPLAGVHDALSAKIFAQHGAPALFLSGFGVSASLLGIPDAGMTNLVEMEMITRHVYSAVRRSCESPPPLIVDGDTGYGGASNMLRTISTLSMAGAAAITIEDQIFPKKCTIAAGSKIQIVQREEACERVRGAIGARDWHYEQQQQQQVGHTSTNDGGGKGTWIVARTDCRMACGFNEVMERCLRFEELGAEVIYAENLQSVEEYQKLRDRLDSRTVTMIAQVQETLNVDNKLCSDKDAGGRGGGKKPLLTLQEIGELGYDLALFGVTPLQCVVGTLDATAKQFLGGTDDDRGGVATTGIITAPIAMADFSDVKQVVGFDELERFESDFPCN
jgi:2-methylisocitrate lyase-like PEP mutase family enzyme